MSLLTAQIGFWKSRIIYDFKPLSQWKLRRFYKKLVKRNQLCFDLGAHTGNRSNTWLDIGAKVVAVEPQPYFVKHLNKRFLGRSNFTLKTDGVGEHEGQLRLMVSSLFPTISTFSNRWKTLVKSKLPGEVFDGEVMVKITTLELLIEEYGTPDFCKIDVEGYELKVLKGLKTPIPVFSFEFFGEAKQETILCLQRVAEIGDYEYNWSIAERLKMKEKSWISYEKMSARILNYDKSKSGDVYARLKEIKRKIHV